MIGEPGSAALDAPRPTRAQQRLATRAAVLAATEQCLMEDGYGALTTRRVAELAGIAQSTLMHHFETRESLLVETVTTLATRLTDDVLAELDAGSLREPGPRAELLDGAWRKVTSPQALAALQLWVAAWSEPNLAASLRELERRLGGIFVAAARVLLPDVAADPRFPALLDMAVSLVRGLVMAIPVSGREAVDARWAAMRPVLLDIATELLDRPPVRAA